MELTDDLAPLEPSSSSSNSGNLDLDTNKKMAPENLLEESWFFGNLLGTKNKAKTRRRMPRSFSDPFPPTICDSQVFDVGSREKTPLSSAGNLSRMPSLPAAFLGRQDGADLRDSVVEKAPDSLLRATTLPACFWTEEDDDGEDQESEFAMSKLIRQASLSSSLPMLPPRHSSKSMTQTLRTIRPQKKPELEIFRSEGCKEKRIQHQNNELKKVTDSLSKLKFEEAQGFRDSTSTCNQVDQTSTSVNMETSVKGKNRSDCYKDRVRRPRNIPAAPPIPNWDDRKRSAQDMKSHIKFWARAVASNVRQEC